MPLKIGDRFTVTIHDIAFGGEGVGRVDDFVVFVPFVLVGERVEVEVREVKKAFCARETGARRASRRRNASSRPAATLARAAAASISTWNTRRSCGSSTSKSPICSSASASFRRDLVAPVIPCPQPYGYRNRIMIRSQWNKPEQKLNIGFVRWDCGLVEDIEECKIAEPALNEQIRHVRAHPPPKGGIKVVLRMPPENWDVPPDSFFQNNFFLLPKLVETVRAFLARERRAAFGGFVLRRRIFRHRTGGCGRIVCRRGIRPARHPIGAAQRGGAQNQQRRIHRGDGRGGFAGDY